MIIFYTNHFFGKEDFSRSNLILIAEAKLCLNPQTVENFPDIWKALKFLLKLN